MDTYQKIEFTRAITIDIHHLYKDAADTQKKNYITLLARNFIVEVGCFELYSFIRVQYSCGDDFLMPLRISEIRLVLQPH